MNFELLKKHAVEVIASVWLVVIAVQYLNRYFIRGSADFTFAYVGMLTLTVLIAVWKAVKKRE